MVDPRERLFSIKSYDDVRDADGRILSKREVEERVERKERCLERFLRTNVSQFPMILIGRNESALRFLLKNPRVSPETFRSLILAGDGDILQSAAQILHRNPGLDPVVSDILDLRVSNAQKKYLIENPQYYTVRDYYNEVLLVLAAANVPNNEIKWLAVLSIFDIVIFKRGPVIAAHVLYEAYSSVDTLQEMAAYFCSQLGVSSSKNSLSGGIASEMPMDKDILRNFNTKFTKGASEDKSRESERVHNSGSNGPKFGDGPRKSSGPKFGDGKQYTPNRGYSATEIRVSVHPNESGMFGGTPVIRIEEQRSVTSAGARAGVSSRPGSEEPRVKPNKVAKSTKREMTDEEIASHLFSDWDLMKY